MNVMYFYKMCLKFKVSFYSVLHEVADTVSHNRIIIAYTSMENLISDTDKCTNQLIEFILSGNVYQLLLWQSDFGKSTIICP